MMRLEVISPQGYLLQVTCAEAILPSFLGEIGVLPGHAPLLVALKKGRVSLKGILPLGRPVFSNSPLTPSVVELDVGSGFAEIDQHHVTLLCEEVMDAPAVASSSL